MARQFVNMIVHDYGTGIYSLFRIDHSKHLFHETREAAQKAQAAALKKNKQRLSSTVSSYKGLPKAAVNFRVPAKDANGCSLHFFCLLRGLGEGCVLLANPLGHAAVYDVASKSVIASPDARFRKRVDSISLCMTRPGDEMCVDEEHRLYVLGKTDGLFEAFHYSRTGDSQDEPPCDVGWYWDRLPLPPPLQLSSWGPPRTANGKELRPPSAAAVVDDATICVSFPDSGIGTYAFDTESRQWSEAGSWVLPIRGAAEYAPEFGLHNSSCHHFCAFDLKSCPPVEQHSWDCLGHVPDCWWPSYQRLLYLGSGKFCIATSFDVKPQKQRTTHRPPWWSDDDSDTIEEEQLTVLTGVEIVPDHRGLQMIKHKSKRFSSPNITLHCMI
ncbi:hypothetical protein ACQ4PT_004386 [Festuca glaucescens]